MVKFVFGLVNWPERRRLWCIVTGGAKFCFRGITIYSGSLFEVNEYLIDSDEFRRSARTTQGVRLFVAFKKVSKYYTYIVVPDDDR